MKQLQGRFEAARILTEFSARGCTLERFGNDILFRKKDFGISEAERKQIARFKPDILDLLDRRNSVAPKAVESEGFPLSPGQERIWIASQFEPANIAYNLQVKLVFEPYAKPDVVCEAIETIVQRHEVLRTSFKAFDGQPKQYVSGTIRLPTTHLDITDSEDFERATSKKSLRDLKEPFDLGVAPLWRLSLIRFRDKLLGAIFTAHHLICDGPSLEVFLDEFACAYTSLHEHTNLVLPELLIQYKEFAAWKRSETIQINNEATGEFWAKKLSGDLPRTEMPADFTRPQSRSYVGSSRRFSLSPELLASMKIAACKAGVSLFSFWTAICRVVLYRYTEDSDVLTGTVVSGRTAAFLSSQIGYYGDVVAIREEISPQSTCVDVIQSTHRTLVDAYKYKEFAFDGTRRSFDGRNPIFNIMISSRGYRKVLSSAKWPFRVYETPSETSKFDLSIELCERDDVAEVILEYATDLYTQSRIERFEKHLLELARQMAIEPLQQISKVAIIDSVERQRLFDMTTGPCVDLRFPTGICDLMYKQAEIRPHDVAVKCGLEQLRFGELSHAVDRLALVLKAKGVQPGDFVALVMNRSVELMVSIYGILRVGAAYVPLDPKWPERRKEAILRDCGAKLILVSGGSNFKYAAGFNALDVSDPAIYSCTSKLTLEAHDPRGLLYLMYTSGSTGAPKGVLVEEAGVMNRLSWMIEYFSLSSSDRILQKTPYTFDVSVWELFVPGILGATQILLGPLEEKDPGKICRALVDEGITLVHFVPAMLEEYLSWPGADRSLQGLRYCLCSGESLSAGLAHRFFDAVGTKVELHNLYGPTEASIEVTHCRVNPEDLRVGIGRPLWNTNIYIEGSLGALMPIGCPGEILIGGVQVARGYLGDEALTNRRFVYTDHFSNDRVYRTGDRGYWKEDGTIAFLGRSDRQVKLRGCRIELDEINACASVVPGVRRTATTLVDKKGYQSIVCYFEGTASVAAIKTELRKSLPEYMVPSEIVCVANLPLTSSGKLNLKALPHTTLMEPAASKNIPFDPTQRHIAQIWEDVLNCKPVGIDQDFFDSGGHSLAGVRVASMLHKKFGIQVLLSDILERRTIRSLAELMHKQTPAPFEAISPASDAEYYPVSDSQKSIWIAAQTIPQPWVFNMTGAFRLTGPLKIEALEKAIRAVVQRHEALRTRFVERKGELYQRIVEDSEVPIRLIDLSAETGSEEAAKSFVAKCAEESFQLATAPLIRVAVIQIEENKWILVMSLHHIVCDGWSVSVITREISDFYGQACRNVLPNAPALEIQFKDYVAWTNSRILSGECDSDRAYWIGRLSGEIAQFPLARANLANDLGLRLSKRVSVSVADQEIVKALKLVCQSEGVSPLVLLTTVLAALEYRYLGKEDIAFGTYCSGRENAAVQDQVGLYVRTLIVRAKVEGGLSFRKLLNAFRLEFVEAFRHQSYPIERASLEMISELGYKENRMPRVIVSMDEEWSIPSLSDMTVEPVEFLNAAAKFELSFRWRYAESDVCMTTEYQTSTYSDDDIQILGIHFREFLRNAVLSPDSNIGRLAFVSSFEPVNSKMKISNIEALRPYGRSGGSALSSPSVKATLTWDQRITQNNTVVWIPPDFSEEEVTSIVFELYQAKIPFAFLKTSQNLDEIHQAEEKVTHAIVQRMMLGNELKVLIKPVSKQKS